MAKPGRPSTKLDYKVFDALLQHKITKRFCAEYMGVSEDTIDRRLKEDKGMTFTEYHKVKMERISAKLQQRAVSMALKDGNVTMLIFCLKNISKWQDKIEIDQNVNVNNFTDWAKQQAKELEAEEIKAIDVTPKKDD